LKEREGKIIKAVQPWQGLFLHILLCGILPTADKRSKAERMPDGSVKHGEDLCIATAPDLLLKAVRLAKNSWYQSPKMYHLSTAHAFIL